MTLFAQTLQVFRIKKQKTISLMRHNMVHLTRACHFSFSQALSAQRTPPQLRFPQSPPRFCFIQSVRISLYSLARANAGMDGTPCRSFFGDIHAALNCAHLPWQIRQTHASFLRKGQSAPPLHAKAHHRTICLCCRLLIISAGPVPRKISFAHRRTGVSLAGHPCARTLFPG